MEEKQIIEQRGKGKEVRAERSALCALLFARRPLISGLLCALLFALCAAAPAHAATATLSWTDNSDNEEGFIVERSLDKAAFAELARVGANVATFVDATLAQDHFLDHEYCYRVAAFNMGKDANSNPIEQKSAYTNTACTTISRAPPADPSDLILQLQQALKAILEFRR